MSIVVNIGRESTFQSLEKWVKIKNESKLRARFKC